MSRLRQPAMVLLWGLAFMVLLGGLWGIASVCVILFGAPSPETVKGIGVSWVLVPLLVASAGSPGAVAEERYGGTTVVPAE